MKRNQIIKLILFLSFILGAVLSAFLFPRLSMPFGFSYILYLMTKPLTLKLTSGTKLQRVFNSVILALLTSSILIPLVASLYRMDTNFNELFQEIPSLKSILNQKFFIFKNFISNTFNYDLKFNPIDYIFQSVETFGTVILTKIPDYISLILEWFFLVPIFLYFFFRESQNFNKWLLQGIPNIIFEKTYVMFSQFNTKFGEYIIAKFIEASIMGILTGLGLFLIDFPYAFIFGLIAAVTNILPYIGPVLGFIPPLIFTLVSKDVNSSLVAITLIYGVVNLIDMILVFPLLVSKIVNLHPIIVVISIIIGSQIGGVVGMLVIIPFVAFFKLLFREIYKDLTIHI